MGARAELLLSGQFGLTTIFKGDKNCDHRLALSQDAYSQPHRHDGLPHGGDTEFANMAAEIKLRAVRKASEILLIKTA